MEYSWISWLSRSWYLEKAWLEVLFWTWCQQHKVSAMGVWIFLNCSAPLHRRGLVARALEGATWSCKAYAVAQRPRHPPLWVQAAWLVRGANSRHEVAPNDIDIWIKTCIGPSFKGAAHKVKAQCSETLMEASRFNFDQKTSHSSVSFGFFWHVSSPNRSGRNLRIEGISVSYKTGDSLAVWPHNPLDKVEAGKLHSGTYHNQSGHEARNLEMTWNDTWWFLTSPKTSWHGVHRWRNLPFTSSLFAGDFLLSFWLFVAGAPSFAAGRHDLLWFRMLTRNTKPRTKAIGQSWHLQDSKRNT